ncbi:MAG: hypothetical protein U1C49_00830 [Candidatus Andersenbacteria bacterium]|nr:hypothetical protein [Candidatus Andersenbacteria bacterium]
MKVFSRESLLIGAVVLLLPVIAMAADVTVTCDNSGCSHAPVGALFTVSNAAPGTSETRSIEVINRRDEVCDIVLNIEGGRENPSGFTDLLNTEITGGQTYWSGGSLADLYQAASVSLGTVGSGASATYDWLIGLDISADNHWQAATASFDFDLGFTCAESGGSTDDATNTGDGSSGDGDGGGGEEVVTDSQTTGQVAGIKDTVSRVLGLGSMAKLTHFPVAGARGSDEINERNDFSGRAVVGWSIVLVGLIVLVRYHWRRRAAHSL